MKIREIIFKEKFIVISLVILLQVLSYIPIIRNYFVAPPDRYYFGEASYPIDMLGDLEIIRDGYAGHWGRINHITSWYQKIPWYFKFEYLLIGQIARLLHIDPLVMHRLAVLAISNITLVFFYWLLTKIFPKVSDRIIAFLLIFFASGIYIPVNDWNAFPMGLKAVGDSTFVFQRFTTAGLHYLLGHLFSLLSLYLLAKTLIRPHKIRYLILMIAFSTLTTLVFAPTMFLILLALPVFILLNLFLLLRNNKNIWIMGSVLMVVGFYLLAAVIPIEYIRFLQASVASAERVIRLELSVGQYLFTIGFIFPLAVLSLPAVIRGKDNLLLIFISFLVAHPLAVYLVQEFNLFSSRRLFQTPYIFVFAVLATLGISTICTYVNKNRSQLSLYLSKIILLLIVFAPGINAYWLSIQQGLNCFCITYPYPYGYPKKEIMEAIWYLRDKSREEEIVLSGFHSGLLIPAFSGNKVYTNWWMRLAEPPEFDKAWDNMARFFSGGMSDEKAKVFLDNNQIKYVFYSEEEKSYTNGNKVPSYPFLQNIYQQNNTTIFAVSRG